MRRRLIMKRSRVMVIVAVLAGSLFLAGPLWSATGSDYGHKHLISCPIVTQL